MKVQALKGFKDILPDEAALWQRLEATAREVFHRYGFEEIRVPVLEQTELFVRTIGEATDIVEKEMYTFTDRNGASLTMRPEGTASVIRAFIEHGLHVRQPIQRLYTIGPMFRHERPQKGRLRQFHQLSVEVLGSDRPGVDSEVMAMAWQLLGELGASARLEINSLGCPECRPAYKESLVGFLRSRQQFLCEDCRRRTVANPLRVLDCKSDNCRSQSADAPSIIHHLCSACGTHFKAVQADLARLAIPYRVNPFMVRGLDYYTRTTFELITDDLGAQSAVGAGGRYDGLISQLGGPTLPGIGFAMGMERLVLLLGAGQPETRARPDIFFIALGEEAAGKGFGLAQELRYRGVKVVMDHEGRSLKSQMKTANRLQARFALILGDQELERGEAVLKNMESGEQQGIALAGAPAELVHELMDRL